MKMAIRKSIVCISIEKIYEKKTKENNYIDIQVFLDPYFVPKEMQDFQ